MLLGRVARDGVSKPAAIPTPVAEAYGLAAPGWTYTVEPVDDPMHDYDAQEVAEPWPGWDPAKSLTMTAALQHADLERLARMFVGLGQFAVISFRLAGSSLTVDPGAALPGRQCRAERRASRAPFRGRADVSGLPPVPLFGPVTLNTSEALREAKGGLVKSAPYLAAGIAIANADEILEIVGTCSPTRCAR